MRLRKLGSGLTALAFCFLLTGFLGSGEKPQDCITAIAKAIDNNDSAAFAERVPLAFWYSMSSLIDGEFQNSMKAAASYLGNAGSANQLASALTSAITPSVERMAKESQNNVHKAIDEGRIGMLPNSPWTSEALNKMVVSEAGTGAEANTATTVMDLAGAKLTLGLVKINDKWMLLSAAGSKKSAVDTALVIKKQVEQRAAALAERRKVNELWLKEFGPIYEKAAKLDGEKLIQAVNENIPSELYEVSRKPKILNISNITLEAPELWNSVTHNLLEGMRSQTIAPITTVLDKSDYTEYNNQLTEIVFRTGDVLITKTLYCSYTETSGNKREGYNKWLSGELNEAGSNTGYMCFVKKDKRWTLVCFVGSSPEDSLFGYLARFRNSFPDPVEYLAEFGKRYATLEANARNILKNEQVWKDSLQKTMKTVGEAIAVKNSKGLATLVDVPRLLRNRDSVEGSALWRLEKTEKNQDVTAFMQEIDTGTLTPDNPLNGLDFATATINSIAETQGVAVAGTQHLLFERANASAPWKLTRVAKNEKTLTLPADWEKQVETKLAELRKEKELEAKRQAERELLQKSITSLHEAIATKNGKAVGNLMDIPAVLRNRDSVEASAAWRLEKTENNQDVTAFIQEINTGTLTPDNPLNGLNLAAATAKSVTETQGVAVAGSKHLLFERANASAPWKLMRVAATENALTLPPDWEKQVETKLAELREEKKRIAEALAQAQKETSEALNAFADALDKKDPNAALQSLNARMLALNPDAEFGKGFAELSSAAAPDAAFTRALRAAISSGTLTSLKDIDATLFSPKALRAAKLVPTNTSGMGDALRTAELLAEDGSPRYIGLTRFESRWSIVTAPQKDTAFSEKLMLKQEFIESIVRYSPQPWQIALAALADKLVQKNSEAVLAALNLPFLTRWNGEYRVEDILFAAATFPEVLAGTRKAIEDSINKDGTFTLNGIRITPETLEMATLSHGINNENGYALTLSDNLPEPVTLLAQDIEPLNFFAAGPAQKIDVQDWASNFSRIQRDFAQQHEKFINETASQSIVASLLDKLVISDAQIQAVDLEGMIYLHLKGSAVVTNTFDKPLTMRSIGIQIVDLQDTVLWRGEADLQNDKALQPNKAIKISWKSSLNFGTFYLLQQVQQGKARIKVFTAEIQLADKRYKREEKDLKVSKQSNGLWSTPGLPPAPLANQTYRSISDKDKQALEQAVKEQITANTAKSVELVNAMFKKLVCSFDATAGKNGALKIVNTLMHPVGMREVQADLIKSGVTENSVSISMYETIQPGAAYVKNLSDDTLRKMMGKGELECSVSSAVLGGKTYELNEAALIDGAVPPLLYQDSQVFFTLTAGQTDKKADAPQAADTMADAKPETPADAPKADTPKAEAPKADAPKAEAPKADTPAQGVTAVPTPPEGKNSGKAVLGTTTLDLVGLTTFGPDGKPDSAIRVSVQNPSPLVAVRIDNIGGTMASWKTSGVKTSAKGVIAVVQDDKPLNAANASFSLDVTKPVVLDLLVQDQPAQGTGVIAEGKTRLRAVFHHQDGKRSYAILEPEKQ